MCGSKLGGEPDRGSLGELTAGAQKGGLSDRSECRGPGQWQGSLISPMKRGLDGIQCVWALEKTCVGTWEILSVEFLSCKREDLSGTPMPTEKGIEKLGMVEHACNLSAGVRVEHACNLNAGLGVEHTCNLSAGVGV